MHKAFHPYKNDRITVADHIAEFGKSFPVDGERARCPFCKQQMAIRASSAPSAIGHFAHMPKSGFCPSKELSGMPYLGKYPKNPDQHHARQIKLEFVNNWQKHFIQLYELVPGLHYEEFKNAIKQASAERIWEYANLEQYHLPYILATIMDYPSTTSYKNKKGASVRKCWFRCWFDSSVQNYNDLWIHRHEPLSLIRAWYRQPVSGKPKLDDLLDFYPLPVTADFLQTEKTLSPVVVRILTPWIDRYFPTQGTEEVI